MRERYDLTVGRMLTLDRAGNRADPPTHQRTEVKVGWDGMTKIDDHKALLGDFALANADVQTSVKPCELVAPRELAARWRMSVRTLDRWRAVGYGPTWLALGGRVLYRLADVAAFEKSLHRPRS